MHATMAQLEVKEMALKINSKKKKKDELPTMAVPEVRWLTGQKGKEQWDAVKAQNEVKRRKKAEAEARKEQAQQDRQERRRVIMGGTTVTFSGGLSSKKVDDLRDIAYALGISDEGHKDSLLTSIKAELERRPELRDNIRFSGLYTTRGQKRNTIAAPTNENLPPANCQRDQPAPPDHRFSHMPAGPSQQQFTPVRSPLGSPRRNIYYPPQYIQYSSIDTTRTIQQPIEQPQLHNLATPPLHYTPVPTGQFYYQYPPNIHHNS